LKHFNQHHMYYLFKPHNKNWVLNSQNKPGSVLKGGSSVIGYFYEHHLTVKSQYVMKCYTRSWTWKT